MDPVANTGWHDGERLLQERAGVAARLAEAGPRVMRPSMPDQHRAFFEGLCHVLVGTVDETGQPWASLAAGPQRFIASPGPDLLRFAAGTYWDRFTRGHLREGTPVALLGLDASTRRRNRANGRVHAIDRGRVEVRVEQSFGNCPRYIEPRQAIYLPVLSQVTRTALPTLDDAAREIIRAADSFFIASAHPRARDPADPAMGVDISHRGGPPGFVQLREDGFLLVPEYPGNSYFNTLGNLALEPRCGLLFIDYDKRNLLQICGRAQVVWADQAIASAGSPRQIRIEVSGAVFTRGDLPLFWRKHDVEQQVQRAR